MPQPASNPKEPNQATPATPPVDEAFDLQAFWIEHSGLLVRLAIIVLAAAAIWGGYEFMKYRKAAGSQDSLAAAKTSGELRKVISEWSGTPAAGSAHLFLAEKLREEGKADEAAQILKEFIEKYPLHPLRAAGVHAQAVSLEIAGKLDEALGAYQRLGSAHSKSAFAPLALLGQARVLTAQGKLDEARSALESIQQQFQGSPFLYEANEWLDEIKNPAGRKTGGSPRPTPAPAPVPAAGPKPVPPQPIPPGNSSAPAPKPAPPQPAPPPPAPPGNAPSPAPAPVPPPIPPSSSAPGGTPPTPPAKQ